MCPKTTSIIRKPLIESNFLFLLDIQLITPPIRWRVAVRNKGVLRSAHSFTYAFDSRSLLRELVVIAK